jgi:hypothetical protein
MYAAGLFCLRSTASGPAAMRFIPDIEGGFVVA